MLDKSVRQIRFSFDPLVPGQGADEAAQLHPGLRSRVVAENTLVVFYAILDSTPGVPGVLGVVLFRGAPLVRPC